MDHMRASRRSIPDPSVRRLQDRRSPVGSPALILKAADRNSIDTAAVNAAVLITGGVTPPLGMEQGLAFQVAQALYRPGSICSTSPISSRRGSGSCHPPRNGRIDVEAGRRWSRFSTILLAPKPKWRTRSEKQNKPGRSSTTTRIRRRPKANQERSQKGDQHGTHRPFPINLSATSKEKPGVSLLGQGGQELGGKRSGLAQQLDLQRSQNRPESGRFADQSVFAAAAPHERCRQLGWRGKAACQPINLKLGSDNGETKAELAAALTARGPRQ